MHDGHLVAHYGELQDLEADFRNSNLFRLVADSVTGATVVDIGCGAAFLAGMLRARGKRVTGIEPSTGMRALAVERNPSVPVVAGCAEEVDTLMREPVDTVLMIDVLEHVEKDAEQLRKVGRILRNGGEFIIAVPAFPLLYGIRDRQMGHYRRYTKRGLKKLLEENGFRVERLRYWNALGVLPYLLYEKVLRKPLQTSLRTNAPAGLLARLAQRGLRSWFAFVENNIDFGFGLSIIGKARKIS